LNHNAGRGPGHDAWAGAWGFEHCAGSEPWRMGYLVWISA
jgi:hypothetical protein